MAAPNPYPQIILNHFQQGCRDAEQIVVPFFRDFQAVFGSAPDERGLTDQMLLALQKRSARVNWERPSQTQEGQLGYDYVWKFTAVNPMTGKPGVGERVAVYIQAKSYKHEVFGGHPIQVADFTYANANGLQMNILDKTVKAAQSADHHARIFGGYILYGSERASFIPLPDVLEAYKVTQKTKQNPAASNRQMSAEFLAHAATRFFLQDIATYGSK